jgi:LysR family transcriptional regulator, benzoate and cis,cis-muconate-responsive activator of ben and cat genes
VGTGSPAKRDTAPAIIARYYAWPELAYVPLIDAAPSTLALARPRTAVHPLAAEVVALTREIAGQISVGGATPVGGRADPADRV